MPVMVWSGARPLTPQDDVWGVVLWHVVIGSPAVGTAFYLLHCRIVADAGGLWIYGWHPRRFIAWNAIEDFELRLPTSNQGGARDASGTRASRAHLKSGGKWRHISDLYLPRQPLLDRIARDAKWATAREWNYAETRDDGDWPKHFEYRDTSGWRLAGMYFLLAIGFSSQIWVDFLFKGITPFLTAIAQMWSFLSFWGRVGLVATPFLMCGSLPLIVLAQYPAILKRRRTLGQKIIATREEISLFRDGRKISLKWDEIDSYHLETLPGHFQPDKGVMEAGQARIEFITGISDTKSLLALVQNRATGATTTQWLHKNGADEDVLGGAASLYRGGNVGVGPKIHHYRTRTSRAMLPLGALMSALLLLSLAMGNRSGTPRTGAETGMLLFFSACVAIPTLWGVLRVCFSHLQCEGDGLRQHSFLGERFLRWDEIESLVFNGHYYRVTGRRQKIRFGLVADCEGLVAEIEKRAGVECKRDGNAV